MFAWKAWDIIRLAHAQEAVTPTKDQEELSKWFNHTWDPNNHSRLQQPKHATTDAEHFVDVGSHIRVSVLILMD